MLLLMAALVVPFLIYMWVSLGNAFDAELQHAQREVLHTAELAAARLDDRLSDSRLLLGVVSQGLAQNWESPQAIQAAQEKLAPELAGLAVGLSIWSGDGRLLADLRPEQALGGMQLPRRPFFHAVLHSTALVVEAPMVDAAGEPLALFGRAVVRQGHPVGLVVATLRLRSLGDMLDPRGSMPRQGVITVFDRQGTIVSRSLDARHWIGRQMLKSPAQRESLKQDFPGVAEQVSFDGIRRIFGHAPLKTVPWTVYVGVPTEVALAPIKERRTESLAFGIAMLLAGVGMACWAAERITRPLRRLDREVARLGRGNMEVRSSAQGIPEIHRLATTLNQTADALQERSQALEEARAVLRIVTDSLPALVSLLDRSERFLFANQAYRDWLGMDPEALIGTSLEALYGGLVEKAMRPHLRAAWAGQRTVYERPMTTVHGERWALVTLAPRCKEGGTVSELCVMILDVTERRVAQEQLARSEERLSLAIEGSSLALFDWDIPKGLIFHSALASVFRGGAPRAVTSTLAALCEHVHPDDLPSLIQAQKHAIQSPDNVGFSAEFRIRKIDGSWVWLRSRGRVVERDAQGRAIRLAGTDVDISLRKATEERLRQLAEYDHLTGLPNRTLFHDRLGQALQRAQRHEQVLAVMFLDIDHFKRVNDTLGHAAGDELLKGFSARLRDGVRKSDTVARLAGDEFTIILEELCDAADALAVAQSLIESIRRPLAVGAAELKVTISVGIAVWAHGVIDGPSLLRYADTALYEAKRQGRDRCHLIEVPCIDAMASAQADDFVAS